MASSDEFSTKNPDKLIEFLLESLGIMMALRDPLYTYLFLLKYIILWISTFETPKRLDFRTSILRPRTSLPHQCVGKYNYTSIDGLMYSSKFIEEFNLM